MQCMDLIKVLHPTKEYGDKKHLGQIEKFECGIKQIELLIFLDLKWY